MSVISVEFIDSVQALTDVEILDQDSHVVVIEDSEPNYIMVLDEEDTIDSNPKEIFSPTSTSTQTIPQKFVGRRGLRQKIYSDNATNFVGASNVLKDLSAAFHRSQEKLRGYAAQRGVECYFIPPRSPHFGGLWEAAVKAAKHRLLRGVGNAKLTADELSTHLVEVEALLNSRPIASTGNDPNDREALTPGHLLIGQPLITLPQESGTGGISNKASCGYLRRWRMLSDLKHLQHRNKWCVEGRDLEVGCLVLVHENNMTPQRWLTGRVVATTVGEDGRVRVAEVRTSGGVIKRAIHKLALLPRNAAKYNIHIAYPQMNSLKNPVNPNSLNGVAQNFQAILRRILQNPFGLLQAYLWRI
ncbi:uncharacterized protein LOC121529823 [Drosophila eugracilis]|uniref:uncharacterized protein LOC121529823 n=1 Tax=Drosophila eugracilis TaxID=29029 RepID=UPI001BDB65BD|nr:uncharacterized protein LOC121529823 [Drosophila eugracilis]